MNDFSLQYVVSSFWSEDFWLPPNISWEDIKPHKLFSYTDYRHLLISLPLAIIMLGLRYALEAYCFVPLGKVLGVKNKKLKQVIPNRLLEQVYARNGKKAFENTNILGLAKQLDWTERQVERWLRIRRAVDRPSILIKFTETCWRWLYYFSSFTLGLVCLWDKPWLWDIKEYFHNYPHQGITADCWCYYMVTLAFYLTLFVSQFFDVKRKDFWPMFIHHVVCICLIVFSWVCNAHRVGTVALLTHDCADVFLEAAKFFRFIKYRKVGAFFFIVLVIVWVVTRCMIYPYLFISSVVNEASNEVVSFPASHLMLFLLVIVIVLNCIWTYFIAQAVCRAVASGSVKNDPRSSSSE